MGTAPAEVGSPDPPGLVALLHDAAAAQASDLHLAAGVPPLVRRDGRLQALPYADLTPARCEELCFEALSGAPARGFVHDLDVAFEVAGIGRCRGSLFRQRSSIAGAFRMIPATVPRLAALGLPAAVARIVDCTHGLVLVAGATGSGKSTTLAALIAAIREARPLHVVTIEDPIEFLHPPAPGLVSQRQVGRDASDFASALRHVLRQDPDVILVGEMRDLETMRAALTLAETGHLVLSTLHSNSALEAADRLIDAFPSEEQTPVRRQVACVLQAVLAQRLLPRRGGGRVAACELVFATPAIRTLIRDAKTHQILTHVQAGRREHGMQTMADALAELQRAGVLDPGHGGSRDGTAGSGWMAERA